MGSAGYKTGAHVVFKLSVHIVFVTKYRRRAITDRVWEVMLASFRESCAAYGCDLMESGWEPDHAHLLVAYPPKVALATLAQHLKGLASRRIRARRFPEVTSTLWGRAFWSPSYCAVSCGGAPLATVKAYVEAQRGLPSPAVGALENWRPKPMMIALDFVLREEVAAIDDGPECAEARATLAHPPKPGHVWLYIPIPHHRMLVEEPFEHSVATPTTTAPGGEA